MKRTLTMALFAVVSLAAAAEEKVDRLQDGLKGEVKAFAGSTRRLAEGPQTVLPLPPPLMRAEYDIEGHRILQDDGNGVAQRTFDAQGRLTEEAWSDRAGQPTKKVVLTYNDFGTAEIASYKGETLHEATRFSYNERGHLVRVERVDGEGKVLIRSEHSRDAQGRLTGWRTVNEKGEVTSHVAQRVGDQGIEEVGSFNADGSPRLHLVADGGNVRYWQQEGDKPTYGSMVPVEEPRKRTTRTYRPGGKFESTVVEFLDDEKTTPQQVAHLDTEGNLTERVEYEYDFDEMGNWTRRVASVCKGGECVALQEDRRKITYF